MQLTKTLVDSLRYGLITTVVGGSGSKCCVWYTFVAYQVGESVKRFANVLLRITVTVLMTAAASYLGFVVTKLLYGRWEVSHEVSRYDGQIGLGIFVTALYGACVCGVVVLCFGILWTVRTVRRSASQAG